MSSMSPITSTAHRKTITGYDVPPATIDHNPGT